MIDREDTSGDTTASATDPTGAGPPLLPPSMHGGLSPEAASMPPLDDLPYLPPATPPVMSAPPVLIGVENVVPRRHATSARRARRLVAVVAGLLLVAGAVAVPIVAGYSWDSSTGAPAAGGRLTNPSAPTTPLVTATASLVPPTLAAPATSPSTIPTTFCHRRR